MSPAAKRIAVLFHERDRHSDISRYIVDHLARFWREDGHEVVYLFGTGTHVPADLVLVHVDLSVVPEEYVSFASRYPIVLNGEVRDIRKSVVSSNLVARQDSWNGPVIVKSDLNDGGAPERSRTPAAPGERSRVWGAARRVAARLAGRVALDDWTQYRVFDKVADVPPSLFEQRDVVVERFLPEYENGLFHVRMYQALGDHWSCTRLASPEPVLKASTSVGAEEVAPSPEVETWRKQFRLDYGKLDYLVHEGRTVLIDVNKTTGASQSMADAPLQAMRRRLADGLYSYFAESADRSGARGRAKVTDVTDSGSVSGSSNRTQS
jgi:hypothetical protein